MAYGNPVVRKAVVKPVVPTKGVSGQVRAMGGRAWGAAKKAANAPVKPVAPSLPSKAAVKAVGAVGKPKRRV